RNPIYYFYKSVGQNANGEVGNPGNKHYKCLHGSMKVLTITKKMKYSLNGDNLKAVSAPMYHLYLAMKEQSPDQITMEEIAVASGNKVLDPGVVSEFLCKVESSNVTIQSAFKKQVKSAAGPWNQEKFEDMLAKWIVATDQPLSTVDEPEFCDLLMYTHHPSPNLHIPHQDAIKWRIMKMGEDMIEATKEMFKVCTTSVVSHN
ncbi:hypothetical protein L208DRAFT_1324604, partial [Tricholoma matsutake]